MSETNKKIICDDIYGQTYEVEKNQLSYRPSIYGILIENNKILLFRQFDGYDIPGGGAEIDETMTETLVREFWEETGIKVELIKPIYCQTSFLRPNTLKNIRINSGTARWFTF